MPHTVPNRPMKGPAEPMVARTSRLRFEPLDLALDGDVQHLVDALRRGSATERPEPSKERFHSRMAATNIAARPVAGAARQRAVELLQRLARPEHLLEAVHRALGAGEQQRLVDDDRPAPDRGGEQAEHHELDDEMGLPEQARAATCRARSARLARRRPDSCVCPRVSSAPVRPAGSSRIPLAAALCVCRSPRNLSKMRARDRACPGNPESSTR